MLGCDGGVYSEGSENFVTALACTQLNGLPATEIGIGFPATSAAAGSGYVSPSVVVAALQCLANGSNCGTFRPPTNHPTIRGVMTWSINWDASNGYQFANTVSPVLRALP
jgi:chitinase